MNAVASPSATPPTVSATAGDTTGQVGMTLASIAYASGQAAIQALLADATLATQGNWTLAWYAADAGNQVYVAQDTLSGQYAIAIRGSVTDPHTKAFWIDWFKQDLSVFRHVDWPYGGAPAGAKISHGSLMGMNSLLSLKDTNGQSLVAFLRATPRTWPTAVVGHSLGGDLASVLAAYLHQEFSAGQTVLDFWPCTFAGPTAGNAIFANWLASAFVASPGRYFNTLDIVPHAWSALSWIRSAFPGGPGFPFELIAPIDAIRGLLDVIHADYTQPGDGVPLTGVLNLNDDWFAEAGAQHSGQNYLALLGAPGVPNGTS